MRIMTVLAAASLAIAGVACSESKLASDGESADTVSVDAEPGGTLNLSLPSSLGQAESTSGTLNLNIGGAAGSEPRLIGSDQLPSVDFSGIPDPTQAIEPDAEDGAEEDDGIIRLQPN